MPGELKVLQTNIAQHWSFHWDYLKSRKYNTSRKAPHDSRKHELK